MKIVAFFLLVFACALTAPAQTLWDVAKGAPELKLFVKQLEATGLAENLKKPGTFTVFAPTDDAFAKLPAGTLEALTPDKLKAMVSYHLVERKLSAADIAKLDDIKTLEGTELDVDSSADGKTIELDSSKVIKADVAASNGVLHQIDRVLQP